MMACTQPGCTGTIVDSYCDICGSPVGAVPFVPAAASSASPAPADEPGLTAVPAPTSAPAAIDEEIPTQPIPRVEMPRQQLSTQDVADPGAADPGAVDAQKVDREKVDLAAEATAKVVGEKVLAEDEPDGAQDYRTGVEQAQLPDDVRKAALYEVGKLERNSDQSAESDDIRTRFDTILDLPSSTETPDSIDIQGSREVEATLRRLIEPAVADVEDGDTAEVEPAAVDVEEGDTAEAEPAVVDVEEGDTAEAEPAVVDVEEGDTAEAEPAAVDVEEGDTAEAEPAAVDVEEGDTAEAEPPGADVEEGDTAEAEPAAADVEEGDTAEAEPPAADVEKADTAPAGPHMTTQYRCLQSLRYLAEVSTNVLNYRNSKSLDLSRFRLLRRKGALDTWRWPPRPWRRCLSVHCCSLRVEIAARLHNRSLPLRRPQPATRPSNNRRPE